MKIIKLENNAAQELEKLKKKYSKILLQFSASWCGPCLRITPELEKVIEHIDDDNALYIYCDIDRTESLAEKYNILSIPAFTIISNQSDISGTITSINTNLLVSSKLEDIVKMMNENGIEIKSFDNKDMTEINLNI